MQWSGTQLHDRQEFIYNYHDTISERKQQERKKTTIQINTIIRASEVSHSDCLVCLESANFIIKIKIYFHFISSCGLNKMNRSSEYDDTNFRPTKEDASPQSVGGGTTILNLNDNCLQEVFECLDTDDLAFVADVCARFRQNAVNTARLKVKRLKLDEKSPVNHYKALRNFGASLDSVLVNGQCTQRSEAEYQKQIIELLSMYCVGALIQLELICFDITDELALIMRPLIGRLRSLCVKKCAMGDAISKHLSIWSPELHKLHFSMCELSRKDGADKASYGLYQHFPKLECIIFHSIKDVKHGDIEEILKQNPQLKRIGMACCNHLNDSIFELFAKYVPEIENIRLLTFDSGDANNAKSLGLLRALKSLTIQVNSNRNSTYLQSLMHELNSANIALDMLNLLDVNLHLDSQSIERISMMRTLKILHLKMLKQLTASELIEICKPLKELSELQVQGGHYNHFEMNARNLLELIRNSGKLKYFLFANLHSSHESDVSIIDENTFKTMLEIVQQRSEKTALEIDLYSKFFSANIREKLIKDARKSLTLRISTGTPPFARRAIPFK